MQPAALEVHEIATLFPAMSGVDRDHLRESIEASGQLEEILVFEGKILDGRHRYETCVELGIAPRLREFTGSAAEAFAYSVALNLSRRHLTTVQRAAAGAGIKEFQTRLLRDGEPELDEEPAEEPLAAEEAEADASEDDGAEAEQAEPEPKPKAKRKPSPRAINAKAREIASKQVGVSGRAIEAAAKIKEEAPDVFERMLAGTAGSLPDARKVTALPAEERAKVHALVDDGVELKAALREVAPPAPADEGGVFLGKVALEPEQAQAFSELLERRGIKRADAAREAIVDWIAKHEGAPAAAEQVAVHAG